MRGYGTWKISLADALSKRLDIPTYSIIQYLKVCWKYGEVLMFCMSQISSLSNIELSIFAYNFDTGRTGDKI